MDQHFERMDELLEALRARGVREVALSGKVATTTTPGGGHVAFRGRIVVTADLGQGERAEYVEQVMPYIAVTKAPEVLATEVRARELRAAQRALARQLRAYRGEYRAVMDAARLHLGEELKKAGLAVVEPED